MVFIHYVSIDFRAEINFFEKIFSKWQPSGKVIIFFIDNNVKFIFIKTLIMMRFNQQFRKLRLLCTVCALLVGVMMSTDSYGQRCENKRNKRNNNSKWGVKGGFSFSNFYVNDIEDDTNLRRGFHAGLGARVPVIGRTVALQPELLYSNKGVTADFLVGGQTLQHEFALNYIDIPIMASVKLFGLNFHAGVYGSYLVRGRVSSTDDLETDFTQLNRSDLAKTAAAQDALGNAKNSSLQLYVSKGIR